MDNLIAIDTYGSQRVKHPHTGQMRPAIKTKCRGGKGGMGV